MKPAFKFKHYLHTHFYALPSHAWELQHIIVSFPVKPLVVCPEGNNLNKLNAVTGVMNIRVLGKLLREQVYCNTVQTS